MCSAMITAHFIILRQYNIAITISTQSFMSDEPICTTFLSMIKDILESTTKVLITQLADNSYEVNSTRRIEVGYPWYLALILILNATGFVDVL